MKAYRLTSNNRPLTNFFEGLTIDEEKEILWSKQDLSFIGGEELGELELYDRGIYKQSELPVLLNVPIAIRFAYLLLRLMGVRLRLTPWTIT